MGLYLHTRAQAASLASGTGMTVEEAFLGILAVIAALPGALLLPPLLRRRYPACSGPSAAEGMVRPLPLAPLTLALSLPLAAGMGWSSGHLFSAPVLGAFTPALVTLALMDVERGLLPNVVIYPASLAALLLHPLLGLTLTQAVLGGLVGFLVFLVLHLLPIGEMGAGDVKLAALLGLLLGFPRVFDGLLIGALLGGLAAFVLLLRRRRAMPYGPFLIAGAVTVLLLPRSFSL